MAPAAGPSHIFGKGSKRARLTGGGLISSHAPASSPPPPAPPSDSHTDRTAQESLFRDEVEFDNLDAEVEGDFEPVASTSGEPSTLTIAGPSAFASPAPSISRVSHLPPPPKKKRKTKTGEDEGEQGADGSVEPVEAEGEESVRGKGKGRGRGRGRGGTTARRGRGNGKAKTGRETIEKLVVPTVEFPEHFVKLEKTFKALNTVYTFCSTRKSMATTFEVLKGSVENLVKRPLEMRDIAQIKSLLPDVVTFAYIDSDQLRVHAAGTSDDAQAAKWKQRQRDLDEAYRAGGVGEQATEGRRTGGETVLLFSFNDGELRSENGVGKVITKKFQRKKKKGEAPSLLPPPETQPKFSAKSMTDLINKRNLKFRAAASDLLIACSSHNPPLDPVQLLLEATEENLPVHPDELLTEEDIRERGVKERKEELGFRERNPDLRPSMRQIIEEMMGDKELYRDQIVEDGHRTTAARQAIYGALDHAISPAFAQALLATKNINHQKLYSHQAAAINALHRSDAHPRGRHVIVSTSTSSGKSLIYQIPAVEELEKDPDATALYVFPTKALAQDQKRSLGELVAGIEGLDEVKIATFDGDTAKEDRDYIRENANVIFTNPDMLHIAILPQEERWRRFFRKLRFVVVDELHIYSGLFGCHVAFVMRRLRRICAALGNRHHMRTIFGVDDIVLVDEDGSPSGRKEHLVWNPPYIDDLDPKQGRVSTIAETSRVFRFLMERGIRVIVFCRVRQDLMLDGRSDMASRVMSYRSGYSAQDRRKIEQEMFSGQLLGVIATTALELGIDIGSLDAVITVGFPYTLPGLRQQAGRAGRRNKDSLAMLICDPFPLDQHYARNPDLIFSSPFQKMALDLDNPLVLEAHIQCAADEIPLHPVEDAIYFTAGDEDKLRRICLNRLVGDDDGFYHCHPRYKPYPARTVPIRNTEDEHYTIVDITGGKSEVVEEVETSRAIFTTYEGAVFMHMGRTFLVREVNHDRKLAKIEEASLEWRTRQRDYTNIDPVEALSIREVQGGATTASYGVVSITAVVFGYFKVDRRNNILDTVDIHCPPFVRSSHGLWIEIPRAALEILLLKNFHPAGSIHAAEHALLSLTPVFAMCAEGDVRTECKNPEKEMSTVKTTRKRPARLILYDTAGKSGGICAKVFDHINTLIAQAADTIANCRCSQGCPSCVASNLCSGANTIVSKLGALIVLDAILGRPIDIDSIPMQELAKGVTPGGPGATIDLAGAGVRPEIIKAAQAMAAMGPGAATGIKLEELEEVEEVDETELLERERALAELMRPAPTPRLACPTVAQLDEDYEPEEAELLEREKALQELMGRAAGAGFDNPRGEAPTEERETEKEQRERGSFRLSETGGFLRGI
ncbi:DNA/RNA helicase, DEAD/DEAH boxtype [Rhodotorula toruloides]|uniref:DNA/RNA helicase, DEAD/DEAH boxtype n=1 Tax=Rhodotorula toruloides TaxID=5286 RepID=A0A511KSL8_RHOTO|nr:DNA/RNA helicase, DEAD/DEAH boxtype [Rhodotorula toruloides]